MKHKKIYLGAGLVGLLLVLISVATLTWTTFTAEGQVRETAFSTGTPDLMLLVNLAQPPVPANLARQIPGLHFTNIIPNWTGQTGIKLYNSGTVNLELSLKNTLLTEASYEPALGDLIQVQVMAWNDSNFDGQIQPLEQGSSLSDWKSLNQWSTQPIDLGSISSTEVKALAVNFRIGDFENTMAGKHISYDFIFNAQGAN